MNGECLSTMIGLWPELGPVTVYSHLQACGIINDHGKDCPCYEKINRENPTVRKERDLEKK